MAYDNNTYGTSPFGSATTALQSGERKGTRSPSEEEALSDHISGNPASGAQTEGNSSKENSDSQPPALPDSHAPSNQKHRANVSYFHLPKGRIANLTMLGEAVGWLMAWGTVGFFRAQVPAAVVRFFDVLFTPWGMAAITLASGLFIGRLFGDYRVKLSRLRDAAVLAIEYGEVEHRADAQADVDRLLLDAEVKTERVGQWLVTWLTALGCLFIIGAFY